MIGWKVVIRSHLEHHEYLIKSPGITDDIRSKGMIISEVEGCILIDKMPSSRCNIFGIFNAHFLTEEVERISFTVRKTSMNAPTSVITEQPKEIKLHYGLSVSDVNERDGHFVEYIAELSEIVASFKYAFYSAASNSIHKSFGAMVIAIAVVPASVSYPACTYSSLQV